MRFRQRPNRRRVLTTIEPGRGIHRQSSRQQHTTPLERASINVSGGKQVLVTVARNCGRIIFDSREIVASVFNRIAHLPEVREIMTLNDMPLVTGCEASGCGEVWGFARCNERMRFLRYEDGEYFRPHKDGSYETPDREQRSYFTLHLYLNDHCRYTQDGLAGAEIRLKGGATTFHDSCMKGKLDVFPKAGRVLLFQHKDLLHSGADVMQGVKYTMRTDLMYALRKDSGRPGDRSEMPVLDESVSREI